MYQAGLEAFKARKFERALNLMQQMVSAHPSGRNAKNGHYWVGECLYGLGRYADAAGAFAKALAFPASDKDDDALLKQGACYVRIERRQDAKRSFQKLLKDHPSSEHVPRAKSYLRKLGF